MTAKDHEFYGLVEVQKPFSNKLILAHATLSENFLWIRLWQGKFLCYNKIK